jgi:hypothetical protein
MTPAAETELADARDALAACIDLFEAWRDGIFARSGITWTKEPPAIVKARAWLELHK